METLVNILLIRMKKQGTECTFLTKIFRKHFKESHNLGDTADASIKLFSFNCSNIFVFSFIFFCAYVCIYIGVLCICFLFVCVYGTTWMDKVKFVEDSL